MVITVRPYRDSDAAATLAIFRRAVHETAAADYSPEQCAAWAPREIDAERWARNQLERAGVVAQVDGVVAGFSDVDATGYIDMMFVDPDYGGRGVATALTAWARDQALRFGARRLHTLASETARPFFAAQGFTVDERREFDLRGVQMSNYAMSAKLPKRD